MAWSKSILKENRFPKTLQKLPVSICQHLNITNLLCHGERSGPVTKHWGTSQSVTDRRPASVLTSHKTCQSWPVIRLVMRRFTCWQLTALKNFLSGQECNRSHCFSAAISLNVSLCPSYSIPQMTCDQIKPFILQRSKARWSILTTSPLTSEV